MTHLPQNFPPRPPAHFTRQLAVDLIAAGLGDATIDDLLEPSFWQLHSNAFLPGDEVRVIGGTFDVVLKVEAAFQGGVAMAVAPDEQPAERRLWIGLADKERGYWSAEWQAGNDWPGPFARGQKNLGALIELVAAEYERGSTFDLTVTPQTFDEIFGADWVGADLAAPSALELAPVAAQWWVIALMPEGAPWRPDAWTSISQPVRQPPSVGRDRRFIRTNLADELRKLFRNPQTFANTGIQVWIRPNWSARELWPDAFPSPPPVPDSHLEAVEAYERRKRLRYRGNRN